MSPSVPRFSKAVFGFDIHVMTLPQAIGEGTKCCPFTLPAANVRHELGVFLLKTSELFERNRHDHGGDNIQRQPLEDLSSSR